MASRVSERDLKQLGDICSKICYHLTAHLASVAAGVPPSGPPEVAQIYQLAAKLPPAEAKHWADIAGGSAAGGAAAAAPAAQASGAAPLAEGVEKGKRLKWTPELEAELLRLVEDDEFRKERLGKDAVRGNSINWAGVARHYGFAGGISVKNKYNELKGITTGNGKKKAEAEADEDKPPAKKAKAGEAPAAAVPPAGKKAKGAAAAEAAAPAPAAETPATGAGTARVWSKKEGEELTMLVEDGDARKAVLGKRKLKWKAIAKHFDCHRKDCRKQYTKLTGKEAPEDED